MKEGIHADSVITRGRLAGNIEASAEVEITKKADFSGVIKARNIFVEDGAMVKDVIELKRESQIKALSRAKLFE